MHGPGRPGGVVISWPSELTSAAVARAAGSDDLPRALPSARMATPCDKVESAMSGCPFHLSALHGPQGLTDEDRAYGGARTQYLNDAEFRNEPDVSSWRRGLQVPVLARSGQVFQKADKVADTRQLHEIAELGKAKTESTHAPRHMVLKMGPDQPRIEGDRLDFRDEVYALVYERGTSVPSRRLTFDIAISDDVEVKGIAAFKRVTVANPRVIGRMIFSDVVASYNGDHVIHFHHPSWREDRNDPSTVVRVDGQLRS